MTKAQLIKALEGFNDTDEVVVEVHDTVLSEDLYDFEVEGVIVDEVLTEIRICPTTNTMNKHDWVHNQLQMNHGSFRTSLLKSWTLASPDNRETLEKAYPNFFTFKPVS